MPIARFQMPDGRVGRFEVPEGTSPEEATKFAENFSSRQEITEPQEQPEGQKGFFERVGKRFEERRAEVSKTIEDVAEGRLEGTSGLLQAEAQIAGKAVAGPILDILGEGFVSLGRGLSFITPDAIEEPVVESFKQGFQAIADTKLGQEAEEAIKGGVESYNKFKTENPQGAKTLESVVNVGLLLAPVKVKAKAEPTILGKGAQVVGKTAAKKIAINKAKFSQDLVSPKKTAKVKIAETARTEEIGRGAFKRGVVTPSPREAEMAKEVGRIKSVSSRRSLQGNLNEISKSNLALAKRLESSVAKSRIRIPLSESTKAIDDAVNLLVKENPTIVGNAERTAQRVATKAKEIIKKNGETGIGLLKSRRELDSWIQSQKGTKIFAPELESTLSTSVKTVRNSMNDLLDSKVTNIGVKRELKRQNLLFSASENLAPKAADEMNSAVSRLIHNASKILPIRNKAIQAMAAAAGVGGLGAAAMFAPYFTVVSLSTIAGGVGVKLLTTPKGRILAGKILRATDKALLSSKNPSMIKQLRADRALLVELLKNVEVQEETQSETQQ